MVGCKSFGQLHGWHHNVFQTNGFAAAVAHEMHMVVVVMTRFAFVFAQGVQDGVVCSRDEVNDALVDKGLQCPVNSHPVEIFAGQLLNIGMRQSAFAVQKQGEDLLPTIGDAELILF